ncbi:MAG: phenylalanine--tRNA ligase subunit beta [Bryobacter sp.]|nr:phenylalanine--tRNA ligase subunit beta [Bryobacter sp.]
MKFSHQWLEELVPGLGIEGREVARLITLHTAESEGVEAHGELLGGACPATVLAVEEIPGAKNRKALVATAQYGEKTLVCGAPNCRAGLQTIYVPLGVKRISGIDSDGMLASAAELGINADDDGIIELSGDAPVLAPDEVIEIDNKSLTHRPDLWGHFGMARELAAILRQPLRDPVNISLLPAGDPAIEVVIEDLDLCPRYSALVFENVRVAPSPWSMQYRLRAIGLGTKNNIVDVTNWLLAELPQPTHAFDADKLHGKIIVRRARSGEKLLALNDLEYELTPADLVIADEAGPIALAGIIGGKHSAITDSTTRIVLESANFHAATIRKTSSRLKVRTDASMRFEKAQDPENTTRAIARAIELFAQVAPGIRTVGGVADVRSPQRPETVISLDLAWLTRKLGREVPKPEVVGLLERLAFRIIDHGASLEVGVPTWRATKDISLPDDLVEEVGRMVGYASIPPTAPLMPVAPPPVNHERRYHNRLRQQATAQGFTEVYNYSFISEQQAAQLGLPLEAHLRVLNPIASDQSLMRTALLHGILKNFEENSKHFPRFAFFEIGKEIHKQATGLPQETPHLAAGFYGEGGLAELTRLAECLVGCVDVLPTADVRPFEHPLRTAEIFVGEKQIGRLFEFHPEWLEGRAAVLDLDLSLTMALDAARQIKYTPIRRFPASEFDLSVLAPPRTYARTIAQILHAARAPRVEAIRFLTDFTLPDASRSLTFRITIADPTRTLTQDDITTARTHLLSALQSHGYELR